MAGASAVAIKHNTKMVNARVSAPTANMAASILKRHGLTVSEFIRGTLEHLVRTSEVPSYLTEKPDKEAEMDKFLKLVETIDRNTPREPIPSELEGLSDKEILALALEEKYGV